MKTHQMPNKWQYLTCIKVSFSNQNLQNDPSSFEKLHKNCIKELIL